jgi:ketosteroid isomerase-like protein
MVGTEELEAVNRYYAALHGTGEDIVKAFDAARTDFIDEGIEWIEPFGTFHGADQVREFIVSHAGTGAEHAAFLAEHVFPTRGTEVCVSGHSVGRIRETGLEFDVRWVHVWEFRDGRAIRMTTFQEDDVMERALGLPEGARLS